MATKNRRASEFLKSTILSVPLIFGIRDSRFLKEVEIPQTGGKSDFGLADRGLQDDKANPRPQKATWHHKEDKEDGVSMQLVDKDVHDKALGGAPHTGGASVVKDPQF